MAATDIIESRLRGTLLDTFRVNEVQINNLVGVFQILDDAGTAFANVESGGITAGTAGDRRLSQFNATTWGLDATGIITALGATDINVDSSGGNIAINAAAGTLNFGNDADPFGINIGTGASPRTITIGNLSGATTLLMRAGTGASSLTVTGIGTFDLIAGTGAINLASNASDHSTTMGSVTGVSATTVQSGTGPQTFTANGIWDVNAVGNVTVDSSAGTIGIGTNADTGAVNIATAGDRPVTLGNSTITSGVTIDSGTGTIAIGGTPQSRTINIGTAAAAQFIFIGSTTGTSAVEIDAGTGNIQIGASAQARTSLYSTGAAAQTVTMGSLTGASSMLIRSGTGNITLDGPNTIVTGNLIVNGDTFQTEPETVVIQDNNLFLSQGYTVAAGYPGGLTVNFLPTATADTIALAASFVDGGAGVDDTVTTVGAATFALGDVIMISSATEPTQTNTGLFVVQSHAANVLTIKTLGGANPPIAPTDNFTQNSFSNFTTTVADYQVTKINVSVIRAGTDGLWEVAQGSANADFTFVDLATSTSTAGQTQDIEFAVAVAATTDSVTSVLATAYPVFAEFLVSTAYSGGTTIKVGSTGSLSLLMATTDIKPTVTGIYRVPILRSTAWPGGVVRVTITGAPAAGVGRARLVYATPAPNP